MWELPLGSLTVPAASPATWSQREDSPRSQLGKTLNYVPSLRQFGATGPTSPQWTELYDAAADRWSRFDNRGTGVGSRRGRLVKRTTAARGKR